MIAIICSLFGDGGMSLEGDRMESGFYLEKIKNGQDKINYVSIIVQFYFRK